MRPLTPPDLGKNGNGNGLMDGKSKFRVRSPSDAIALEWAAPQEFRHNRLLVIFYIVGRIVMPIVIALFSVVYFGYGVQGQGA